MERQTVAGCAKSALELGKGFEYEDEANPLESFRIARGWRDRPDLSGDAEILEKAQDNRVIKTVGKLTGPNGQDTTINGRYCELQAGMYYWDNGQCTESREVVEPYPRRQAERL